jgi:hypothetical protein
MRVVELRARERGFGGAPLIEVRRHDARAIAMRGELVEDDDVFGRIEEGLVFVLAVQVDERRTQFPQRRRRRQRVVDEGAAAPLRGDLAAHDHFVSVGAFEDRLDRRDRFAGAHEVGAGASADEQVDGFDDYGLAGAGFAGEDVQAGFELDFETFDDRQVAHAEKAKHVETGTPIVSNL